MVVELSEQLRRRQTELRLGWVRRDRNQEADDLTNEKFDSFDANLRVQVDPLQLKWQVMPMLMAASQELYETIVKEKEARTGTLKPFPWKKIKASARIRTAQPW